MVTLTLELPEAVVEALKQIAEREGSTPEAVAAKQIMEQQPTARKDEVDANGIWRGKELEALIGAFDDELTETAEISSKPKTNWALAMAQAAQESGIEWKDIPDLSERGSDINAEGLYNDWKNR